MVACPSRRAYPAEAPALPLPAPLGPVPMHKHVSIMAPLPAILVSFLRTLFQALLLLH